MKNKIQFSLGQKRHSILFLFLITSFFSKAVTINWVVGNVGDWETASNWDCNCIPTAADDVVIDGMNSEVTVGTANAVAKSVNVKGFSKLTINSSYSLTVDGLSSATDGVTVQQASELTISGTLAVSNTTNIGIYCLDCEKVKVSSGATVNVHDTGNDGLRVADSVNPAIFENSGTVTINSNIGADAIRNIGSIQNMASGNLILGGTTAAGTALRSVSQFNNFGTIDVDNPLGSGVVTAGVITDIFRNESGGMINIDNTTFQGFQSVGEEKVQNAGDIIFTTGMSAAALWIREGVFENEATGLIRILNSGTASDGILMGNSAGEIPDFDNAGTIEIKTGIGRDGLEMIGGNFINSGTIDIDGVGRDGILLSGWLTPVNFENTGTITIKNTGSGTNDSSIDIIESHFENKAGGTVNVSDATGWGIITSNGLLHKFTNNGDLNIGPNIGKEGFYAGGDVKWENGNITGNGEILFIPGGNGNFDWSGGNMKINSDVGTGGLMTISGSATKTVELDFNNFGTVNHGDGDLNIIAGANVVNEDRYNFNGGSITLANNETFENKNLFYVTFDGTVGGSCNETFINTATGVVTRDGGSGTISFDCAFQNNGTVNLNCASGYFECFDFDGGSFATTDAPILGVGGGSIDAALTLSNDFTFEKGSSGFLTVSSPVTAGGFIFTDGVIIGSSSITANNSINWIGGQLGIPMTIPAGGLYVSGSGTKTLSANLTYNGPITMNGGTWERTGAFELDLPVDLNWTADTIAIPITIQSGKTLTISGTAGNIVLDANLVNDGTIDHTIANADLQISPTASVINNGTYNFGSGVLSLFNSLSFTNNGLFDVQGDGVLGGSCTEKFINSSTGEIRKSAGTGKLEFFTKVESGGLININSGDADFACIDLTGGVIGSTSPTTVEIESGTFTSPVTVASDITIEKTSTGTWNINDDLILNGNLNQNQGDICIAPAKNLDVYGTFNNIDGFVKLGAGTKITNHGSAVFIATDTISGFASSIFDNSGIFRVNGPAVEVQSEFENKATGTIEFSDPFLFLQLSGNFIQNGNILFNDVNGLSIFNGGIIGNAFSINNNSVVDFIGGTIDVNVALTSDAKTLVSCFGATVSGTGSLTINGDLFLGAGTLDLPTTISGTGSGIISPLVSITLKDLFTNNGFAEHFGGDFIIDPGGSVDNNNIYNWGGGNIDLAGGTSFINDGSVILPGFGSFTGGVFGTGTFTNNGTFESNLFGPPTSFDFQPDFTNKGVITQTTGGSSLSFSGNFDNQATGTTKGSGTYTFSGGLTNDGIFSPGNSPGILAVNTFENSGSTLTIEIDDNTGAGAGHDQLQVSGTATIDGTLTIPSIPSATGSWTIVTCGTCTGTFTTINYPGAAADWTIQYNATDIIVTYSGVLPVELIDFQAITKEKSVELNWSTASETNNAGFEILKSENGFDFEKIGWIDGAGNSVEVKNYEFEDADVRSGGNYFYKLKQVDFDGEFEFSKIVTVNFGDKNDFFVGDLFPNPTSSGLSPKLNLNLPEDSNLIISAFSLDGKMVFEKETFLQKGNQIFEIEKTDFSKGSYFFKIQIGKKVFYKKLIFN